MLQIWDAVVTELLIVSSLSDVLNLYDPQETENRVMMV